ncbi:glycosyltransferase [Duganella sp. FT109W]|uniref:Glycosyltransferase n=1 Tax=Duganella margarita TaxID=2692170 RepID=A0ABW9WHR1_9BURK|nr:glycosyltransferase family 1 protein [Duganella margarita]MYN39725.1 glycosyltransferase [Duganella margarita]
MNVARQLLVDLSVLVHQDDHSGIQRLARNLLQALQAAPPAGYVIAPVYDAGGYYAYAEQLAPAADGAARAIQVRAGDIFLGLDLCPDQLPHNRAVLDDLRRHGVRLYFVVYDLLPLLMPAMFIEGAAPWFARWLDTVAATADGLLCISHTVADELCGWLEQQRIARAGTLRVAAFPLGADFEHDPAAALPAHTAVSAEEQRVLDQLALAPTLLMVGTLEPRKMHHAALDAFEQLWAAGTPAQLVIVGKPGWMTETLAARIEAHPERGQRLFWLRHAGDATLRQLYRRSTALLAASAGEGYGLPLIEAAHHGLPIIARDIPVFREVCGDHAWYFDGDAATLAAALTEWLVLHAAGRAPASAALPRHDWADSARALSSLLLDEQGWRVAPTCWL